MFECCLIYAIHDYSDLNGKGRERRRPGTAAEPEVTLSTGDAYGQGRAWDPKDMCEILAVRTDTPSFGKALGRHGRVCLV